MNNSSKGHFSIVRQLLLFLLLPLLFIVSVAAVLSVVSASRSVNEVYDLQMKSSAEILLAFLHYEMSEHGEDDDDDDEDEDEELDEEDLADELVEVVGNIESQRGLAVNYRLKVDSKTLFTSGQVRYFEACPDGYHDFSINSNEGAPSGWRCYGQTQTLVGADMPLQVEFFEPVKQRRDAIKSILINTFLPIFFLPAIVLLVTLWVVRNVKNSLKRVTDAVGRRSVDNLDRLARDSQPQELLPVVDSVNKLLAGIERGVLREKQFTDDAAHELRTPLTSIKMLEQLLRRENRDPALITYLDSLQASVEQSHNLTEQLLVMARMQTTQSLETEPVDLGELLQATLGLLSPQITGKALAIDFQGHLATQSEAFLIIANKASIELLISNLLTNAIKFSPDNGTIYILSGSDWLKIEDDGCGIPIQDAEFVFDRFYRGSASSPGTGLGLALAKSVAEAHGFRLTLAKPSAGEGASFLLNFGE